MYYSFRDFLSFYKSMQRSVYSELYLTNQRNILIYFRVEKSDVEVVLLSYGGTMQRIWLLCRITPFF
jgi:hypothetical protein